MVSYFERSPSYRSSALQSNSYFAGIQVNPLCCLKRLNKVLIRNSAVSNFFIGIVGNVKFTL